MMSKLWRDVVPNIDVSRRFKGKRVYMSLRDHLYHLVRTHRSFERYETGLHWLPDNKRVWDVGCNIGMYAVQAALNGCNVYGFDISPSACRLLNKTAAKNNLSIMAIPRAMSIVPFAYTPPLTAHPEEQFHVARDCGAVDPATFGFVKSIGYLDAARSFGVPDFIKMDIEGAELEFLKSREFLQWLVDNSITWLVELHGEATHSIARSIGDYNFIDKDHKFIRPQEVARWLALNKVEVL